MQGMNFKKVKRGFTLIELMAAMTITALLVVVIASLTSKGVEIWRWVINDVRTTTQARSALDTMLKDVESMQVRAGNNFEWLVAEKDRDLDNLNNMKMGPDEMKAANASRLIFFTTALDRTPAIRSGESALASRDYAARKVTAGDINCVGYKLEYKDQILNEPASENSVGFPVYSLYRSLIPAYRTYEELLGRDNLLQAYKRYEDTESRPLNFLVENIVEMTLVFEVDYQSKTSSGTDEGKKAAYREIEYAPLIASNMSSTNAYRRVSIYGDRIRVEKQGTTDEQMKYGTIVGVTISLTVVTDEGMAIVDEVRRGRRAAPDMKDFFKRYTKQFSQRVDIPKPN